MTTKFTFDQIETAAITPFFSSPGAPAPPAIRGARGFFGDGWRHGQQTDGNVTGGSWLQSFVANGTTVVGWDYGEDNGRLVSVSNFGLAITAASRTTDGVLDAQGFTAFVLNDGVGRDAYGAYLDAVKSNASAKNTFGLEIDTTNMPGPSPMGGATPYRGYVSGMTGALTLATGSDASLFGRSYAVDWLLNLSQNGGAAWTGINVRFDAIRREGEADNTAVVGNTGYARVMGMAHDQGLSWYSRDPLSGAGTQAEVFRLYSTADNPATAMEMVISDTTISFNERSGTGAALFQIGYIANAGAAVRVLPVAAGSAPIIEAQGTDTNINLLARGKGTGLFGFGTLTASADAAITGYVQIATTSGAIVKLAVIT